MRKANIVFFIALLVATAFSPVNAFTRVNQPSVATYDVDGDHVIAYADAIAVLSSIGGPYNPVFDVNDDGVVNGYDAVDIITYLENLPPTPTATAVISTATPLPTETSVPTATETPTLAPTSTSTPAPTDTNTPSPTRTDTPSPTPTKTSTPLPTSTSTPAPTSTPMVMVGRCGELMDSWHSPTIDGCDTWHEHGDAPPSWVLTSGKAPVFSHSHSTGMAENMAKHFFMKGYLLVDKVKTCLSAYVIQHGSSMGMERIARFHSTQFWVKDCSGAVSYGSYWSDFGIPGLYPNGHRVESANFDAVHSELANEGIMRVNRDAIPKCEQWYSAAGGNRGDVSLLLCNSVESYTDAETTNPSGEFDSANWQLTGGLGLFRQLELVWPKDRILVGNYITDQFGNVVSGCPAGSTSSYDGVSYPRQCGNWSIKASFLADVNSKVAEFGIKRAFFLYRNESIFCGPGCRAPN